MDNSSQFIPPRFIVWFTATRLWWRDWTFKLWLILNATKCFTGFISKIHLSNCIRDLHWHPSHEIIPSTRTLFSCFISDFGKIPWGYKCCSKWRREYNWSLDRLTGISGEQYDLMASVIELRSPWRVPAFRPVTKSAVMYPYKENKLKQLPNFNFWCSDCLM